MPNGERGVAFTGFLILCFGSSLGLLVAGILDIRSSFPTWVVWSAGLCAGSFAALMMDCIYLALMIMSKRASLKSDD